MANFSSSSSPLIWTNIMSLSLQAEISSRMSNSVIIPTRVLPSTTGREENLLSTIRSTASDMSASHSMTQAEVVAMDSTVICERELFSRSPIVLFSFFQLLSMISLMPTIPVT